jgi:hypothetical protein
MHMYCTAEAFEFVSENLNMDVAAIDEIICRIGRFGVLGVSRTTA